ncbi:MAG TPA: hypothetical protein PKZ32_04820 [Candidatus Melainabacteria bacterium]|nr:hypothetical protein [Candidatus Melainabacteria bacterium]
MKVLLDLIHSILGSVPSPRIDGLDCDCGGSDCGGSDCSDANCSDCNSSELNCSELNSSDVGEASSSADVLTDSSEGSSGSSSERRTRDAGLIGGAAAGAAAIHQRRKKGQRNANDATDDDLANIPRCQRRDCRQRGNCDCGGSGRISLRK